MRKVIGAIVLGIMMSTFAYAQEAPDNKPHHERRGQREITPEERSERMIQRLTEQLDLTEDQQAELKAFHLAQGEEGRAQMAEAQTREARHEIREAHRRQMDEKLEALLSEEQMEKYETMKENRPEHRRQRKGRHRGPRD